MHILHVIIIPCTVSSTTRITNLMYKLYVAH